ncbi:MAG: LUD domain-containing protein [Pseudomonadota bacterium]
MSAREAILGKIRKGLAEGPPEADRRRAAAHHIAQPSRHPIPERVAGRDPDALKALFKQHLEGQDATVLEIETMDDVPDVVSSYLRDHNLPQRVRVGADPRLGNAPWQTVPALEVQSGRADPTDEVGVSHAAAGVAETGTLVMTSGADNPVTLNFVPETHIVVVSARDLVGPYEDAFAAVRDTFGAGQMPRTVNMISGPSRTGDIGGRIVMGAHGPRRMCVVIVNDTAPAERLPA